MATILSLPSGVWARGSPQPRWLEQLQGPPGYCHNPSLEGLQGTPEGSHGERKPGS